MCHAPAPPAAVARSDVDILCHWLAPGSPTRVSSFGSLQHFRKDRKPPKAGAATRCLDCAHERDCAYSAKKGACAVRPPAGLAKGRAIIPARRNWR